MEKNRAGRKNEKYFNISLADDPISICPSKRLINASHLLKVAGGRLVTATLTSSAEIIGSGPLISPGQPSCLIHTSSLQADICDVDNQSTSVLFESYPGYVQMKVGTNTATIRTSDLWLSATQ